MDERVSEREIVILTSGEEKTKGKEDQHKVSYSTMNKALRFSLIKSALCLIVFIDEYVQKRKKTVFGQLFSASRQSFGFV